MILFAKRIISGNMRADLVLTLFCALLISCLGSVGSETEPLDDHGDLFKNAYEFMLQGNSQAALPALWRLKDVVLVAIQTETQTQAVPVPKSGALNPDSNFGLLEWAWLGIAQLQLEQSGSSGELAALQQGVQECQWSSRMWMILSSALMKARRPVEGERAARASIRLGSQVSSATFLRSFCNIVKWS